MNLIDFGRNNNSQGSVRVSVLEAFDPLLTQKNNIGEWLVFHSRLGNEKSFSNFSENAHIRRFQYDVGTIVVNYCLVC